MLVLTRRVHEKVIIGDGLITITVIATGPFSVRLGIHAPPELRVDRKEIHERRQAEREDAEREDAEHNEPSL
jgi:carbon storage regulator